MERYLTTEEMAEIRVSKLSQGGVWLDVTTPEDQRGRETENRSKQWLRGGI